MVVVAGWQSLVSVKLVCNIALFSSFSFLEILTRAEFFKSMLIPLFWLFSVISSFFSPYTFCLSSSRALSSDLPRAKGIKETFMMRRICSSHFQWWLLFAETSVADPDPSDPYVLGLLDPDPDHSQR